MYMQPIVPVKRAKSRTGGTPLKLAVGAVAIATGAVLMTAYWAATAAWLVVAGIARGAATVARQVYDCLLFAGEEVVGR